jgi:hypothetical protein
MQHFIEQVVCVIRTQRSRAQKLRGGIQSIMGSARRCFRGGSVAGGCVAGSEDLGEAGAGWHVCGAGEG